MSGESPGGAGEGGPMNARMSDERLAELRSWADGDRGWPGFEHVDMLLSEVDRLREELAEMERERDMYRHAFDRLASRVVNTILPSDDVAEVEGLLSDCTKVLDRLRRGYSFASELAAMARAYEKKAQ